MLNRSFSIYKRKTMRLNQFIAACGVCSRREADKLIAGGKITVNGEIPSAGMQVSEQDEVIYNGKKLSLLQKKVVLAYYKEVGVVCTEKDKHAKRTVIDEISYPQRVTYAGRLDKDSEGLMLLSNDGNLINSMMKSINNHEKEYVVLVDKEIDDDFIKKMSEGVYLKDLDRTTRACRVTKKSKNSFNIVLTQGLNRQIRRMCESLGYNVVSLKRTRIMSVELDELGLKPGEYVELGSDIIKKLYAECGL